MPRNFVAPELLRKLRLADTPGSCFTWQTFLGYLNVLRVSENSPAGIFADFLPANDCHLLQFLNRYEICKDSDAKCFTL